MMNTEIDDFIDNNDVPNETTENRSTKKKRAPKAPANETEMPVKSSENKRKAPKIPNTTNIYELDQMDETKERNTLEKENSIQDVSIPDQETPIKSKKKRAPKIEIVNENNDSLLIEESIKKKKSKAPKSPINDDDFQMIETSSMDLLESTNDVKPKKKKSKKVKQPIQTMSDSFENLQNINLNDVSSTNQEIDLYPNDTIPMIDDMENPAPFDNDTTEYEAAIMDAYNNLASGVNFTDYVGGDQWAIINFPKSTRTDGKNRIKKLLPGGNKDEKAGKKTTAPKSNFLTRFRNGLNTLVRDEKNLLFGEPANVDVVDYDDPDGVDTDDLNRYAQKLRELEDKDREINPEFLVIRDGKTIYGVHEPDADGKVKLAKRKPIFDRYADQRIDEQAGKKTLLSILKSPFARNRDKNGNDMQSPNLGDATPNTRSQRKSHEQSIDEDVTMVAYGDSSMI